MKKVREGYKMTELGEIPIEWEISSLSNITNLITKGTTPMTYGFSFEDEGINFIKVENINESGFLNKSSLLKISEECNKKLSRSQIQENDILISIAGTLGRTIVIQKDIIPANTNQALAIIRIKDENNVSYINKALSSSYIKNKINMIGTVGAQPNLSLKQIGDLKILIPTIEEQEKIASILSTVDEKIDNVNEIIEKNKELKKGLMQQLLIKGIGHTKFKKTEIGEIPETWEVKSLEDFSISNSYGPRFSADLYDEDGNCRVIRGTDVIDNGKVKYEEIPCAKIDNQVLETHRLIKNDFIVVTTADCGMSFVFNNDGVFMPSAYMVRIRFNKNINPYFVSKFFETKTIKKQVEQHIRKGTIANLPGSDLLKFKICVPPLLEQERIVLILSELDKKIDEYESKRQKLEELKKGLMQQLLTGKMRV